MKEKLENIPGMIGYGSGDGGIAGDILDREHDEYLKKVVSAVLFPLSV